MTSVGSYCTGTWVGSQSQGQFGHHCVFDGPASTERQGKSGLSKYCRALNRQNNTPSKNPWHDQVHEPIVSDLCLSDSTSPLQITCHVQQVTSYHFEYTANVSNSNFLVSSINAPERASSQHRRASTCRTSSAQELRLWCMIM